MTVRSAVVFVAISVVCGMPSSVWGQGPVTAGTTALLAEPKGMADLKALRAALDHADASVRAVAARVAGFLKRDDFAPPLLDAIAREQDAEVAAEQVRAILCINGVSALPQARAAAKRLRGPVALATAEWLARNQPQTFAGSMADVIRDVDDNYQRAFALIVAMAMRQTPAVRAEISTAYAASAPRAAPGATCWIVSVERSMSRF
jgi:hypothetical protein